LKIEDLIFKDSILNYHQNAAAMGCTGIEGDQLAESL
jgi:hypothetical protein